VGLAAALTGASAVAAQTLVGGESPRLERVVIRGVQGVDVAALRVGLANQPSHCRTIFLKPFCWVSGSPAFVEAHRLDRVELPRDELRIRVFLWRRGWRHSTVRSTVTPEGRGVQLTFDVDQGPPTVARSVDVVQPDGLVGERQLRALDLPEAGEPVDVVALDSARATVLALLADRGYPDAAVRDTILPTDSLGAAVRLEIEPGRRSTIGAIAVEGNERVSDATILDAMPLRTGRLYRVSQVEEAQRALYLTGMFRQALVTVPAQPDTAKTVVVAVEEAPFRQVRTRVGVSTVDYVRAEAQYTHYDWLGGGRRLDVTGVLGRLLAPQLNGGFIFREIEPAALSGVPEDAFLRPTWQASAQVTQPAFPAAGASVGLGVFAHRRVESGVVVDRGEGANLTFTKNLADRAPLSVLYRYERNTVLAGDVYFCVNFGVCDQPSVQALQGSHSLSPLQLSVFVDRVDDQLARSSGYTARLGLEHASRLTLSDFRYNRVDAEIARDVPLGGGTLAGRVHGGWVRARSSTGAAVGAGSGGAILHPTTRFYAGGARSVRGFAENQLGPRILTLDPRKLLTAADSGAAPCTEATLASGRCDPNGISSSEFVPRPTGGTRLVEASIEYRHPLWRSFVAAVFLDGARLDDPQLADLARSATAVTPGFGIRYRSPIGPVRVDLGIRPARTEDLRVVTQVTEGGVNRLVLLDVPKHYDPLEGGGGFLRQLTSRLTLHLSVGEAY
jgi:outer membrane protein insertion porin family/translocation and assembly module TamA